MATLVETQGIARTDRSAGGPGASRNGHQRVGGLNGERVARGLGWFSIGLGAAELIAPSFIARLIGSRNHRSLIRVYGLRELAAGAGILASREPAGWLWSRVAGDIVDLASFTGLLASQDSD